MALKAVLDTLDGVDEALQAEYTEKDGKFYLDIEGLETHPKATALRNALDRVREEKKTLQTKVDELEAKVKDLPDDFTIDEWDRLRALDDDDDPEKRKNKTDERVAQVRQQMQQQIDSLKKQLEDKDNEHKNLLAQEREARARERSERELDLAMDKANIDPKYRKAVRAMHSSTVKHDFDEETGDLKVFVETDLGEATLESYMETWAKSDEGKVFVSQASGPGAEGAGRRGGVAPGENPFTPEGWNKTKQSALREDTARGERLAKAAGFPDLATAMRATRPVKRAA